ncbi:uncharacterized protein VDAG_04926 [Verticillium dahliae VdLs.17]|uniref:Uncharacterized protein n=1 Tax=Verticillium dahliae (strain VdLs.17 / ATCC MYA-4575 / FGSC 10137) TaxID=498257 RepID=G2X3E1_VERDV|nr:uncharacterized protein VDAG_04926 [Verticillium dahliae VdLs.17]EGY23488.1 hypothetical protein VDAG_04926 [Verticillium dahliae VdLs.17]KAH6708489.1 hypothetical protein EV126DRAFT_438788 [Verticillium dahliae]
MSFIIQSLSKDADFFKDAKTSPTTVDGSGQTVYWQNCSVLVFEKGNLTDRKGICDGEGEVRKGLTVWFGGGGKVKEE